MRNHSAGKRQMELREESYSVAQPNEAVLRRVSLREQYRHLMRVRQASIQPMIPFQIPYEEVPVADPYRLREIVREEEHEYTLPHDRL